MPAQPLDTFLRSADALARLRNHADRLAKLQRAYADVVPAFLAASSRVANYNKLGNIVVHTDNGAVAAKLKQLVPSLRDELCKRGCEVTEILIKAQPSADKRKAGSSRTAASVSANTKAGLSKLADAIPQDSPLKEALERLVQRSR